MTVLRLLLTSLISLNLAFMILLPILTALVALARVNRRKKEKVSVTGAKCEKWRLNLFYLLVLLSLLLLAVRLFGTYSSLKKVSVWIM